MQGSIRQWDAELTALHARIGSRFRRAEPRQRALGYLRGLLSPVARKNGWQLAEHLGERTPDGVQRLLNGAEWDADRVRDDLRAYVVERLADPEAVLVVDETGFLKKGRHSVGVKRQYSGTAGRIENSQVGVFLAYASVHGAAFLDRALYLPKEWAAAPHRRAEAHVPEGVTFRTKPGLALEMIERALDAGVPCRWVTGDEVYGGDRRLRFWLEQRRQPFVLGVACNVPLWRDGPVYRPAQELAAELPASAWQRHSAGDGAKGPREYDRAWQPLWRWQPTAEERAWGHWLVVRRSLEDPSKLAYYVAFAPREGTTLETLIQVAGRRWTIEVGFERAKQDCGLDEYEGRTWDAWHRHITLALLAQAFLVAMSTQAKKGALRPA
ncbi:IS701 family transposase [Methylocaldum gracile]